MFNEDDYNAMMLDEHYHNDRFMQNFDLDAAKDYLSGCLESIYENGDIDKLEHCLEELCYVLNVPFAGKTLKIEKKDHLLQEWYKGYSQAMVDLQREDEKCGDVV